MIKIEINRREKATIFFDNVLDFFKEKRTQSRKIMKHLDDLKSRMVRDNTIMLETKQDDAKYIIKLHDMLLKEVTTKDSDFNLDDFVASLENKSLVSLAALNIDGVSESFNKYANTLSLVTEYKTKTVDDAFRRLDEETKKRVIENLDMAANPMWSIAREELQHEIQYIYLIGVNSEGETCLNDDDNGEPFIHNHVGDRIRYALTNDPNRIYFFKLAAAVPAYCLNNMGIFKTKYLAEDARYDYHVDRRWKEKMDAMDYDLFPGQKDGNSLLIWSLANAFGYVQREGLGNYKVKRSDADANLDAWFDLETADRREAFNAFEQRKMIDQTLAMIKSERQRIGDEKVISKLAAYRDALKDDPESIVKVKRATLDQKGYESIKKLLNNEFKTVQKILESKTLVL